MVRYVKKSGFEKPYLIPNNGPVPHIGIEEGFQDGPVPICSLDRQRLSNYHWKNGLKPWERLFHHETMSSARRHVWCRRPFEPKDELDFVLSSSFDPEKETMPDQVDVYIQPETKLGEEQNINIREKKLSQFDTTFPSNRFIERIPDLRKPFWQEPEMIEKPTWRVLRNRMLVVPEKSLPRNHPITYGGVIERRNVDNVKLGVSADHTSQTNPGYSRTPTGSYYSV